MDYLPCIKRKTLIEMKANGSTFMRQRCTHQSCESFGHNVIAETCAACPLRMEVRCNDPKIEKREFAQPRVTQQGHLIYPRTGWEPPKVPDGYVRKSEDLKHPDAWHFIPQWPSCSDRVYGNTVKPCGCVTIMPYCRNTESVKNGQLVMLPDCAACPVRH